MGHGRLTTPHGMREAGERVCDGEVLGPEQISTGADRQGGDELTATRRLFAQGDGNPSRWQPLHLEAA